MSHLETMQISNIIIQYITDYLHFPNKHGVTFIHKLTKHSPIPIAETYIYIYIYHYYKKTPLKHF